MQYRRAATPTGALYWALDMADSRQATVTSAAALAGAPPTRRHRDALTPNVSTAHNTTTATSITSRWSRVSNRQGQQRNELWAGPAAGSAASRTGREWVMGRAGERVSNKQRQQRGQQQAGPAGNELWAGPAARWAMGRAGNRQGPGRVSYGQGRQ